jgi:hypothetical protein
MEELTQHLGRIAAGSMAVPDSGTDLVRPDPAPDPVFRPCRTNGPG